MNVPALGARRSPVASMTMVQRDSVHDDCRAAHLRETDPPALVA